MTTILQSLLYHSIPNYWRRLHKRLCHQLIFDHPHPHSSHWPVVGNHKHPRRLDGKNRRHSKNILNPWRWYILPHHTYKPRHWQWNRPLLHTRHPLQRIHLRPTTASLSTILLVTQKKQLAFSQSALKFFLVRTKVATPTGCDNVWQLLHLRNTVRVDCSFVEVGFCKGLYCES